MCVVYSPLFLHEQCPPTQTVSLSDVPVMYFYGLVISLLTLHSAELRRLELPRSHLTQEALTPPAIPALLAREDSHAVFAGRV